MQIAFKAATCIATLMASASAFCQGAESYPSRSVSVVIPFAQGGSGDIAGRIWLEELSKNVGQRFVMDYKPGGVQRVGMNYALRQKPDGYTLVLTSSTYSLLPLMTKDMSFDPYKDFDPVVLMSKNHALLVVSKSLPVTNIKEFIAYAKANPGKMNLPTGGSGGIQHLTGLWLSSITNTQINFTHYKSIGASFPDLMAGRVHVSPGSLAGFLPMVKAGKIRAIASASLRRNTALPDLSTATEQGLDGFEYSSWLGVITPTKTPAQIVNKLYAEFVKVSKSPEIREKLGEATDVLALGPEEFRKVAMGETLRFRKLLVDNNLEIEE